MRFERSRDRGFTLTELLVVITLTGIIGSIIVAAVTTGLHKQTQVQDRSDAMAQARTALQRVDRDIRSSYPLLTATNTSIKLCETQPSGTRLMVYSVVASGSTSNLVVDQYVVSSCYPQTLPTATESVLLRNIVNTSALPVFNYSESPTYTVPSDGSVNASCVRSGISPVTYDPSCVGTVTVSLKVQPASLTQPVSLSDNGTQLRNPA